MTSVRFPLWIHITIFVCLLFSIVQIHCSNESLESDEDFPSIHARKKPHRRKSARMAFIEETDDPMFKFLTKLLNTAQMRHKNALTRAQNGVKETEKLKTDVKNELKKNHISVEYFE